MLLTKSTDNIQPPSYIYLWRMIFHPFRSAKEIAVWKTVWPGLIVVLLFGTYLALGCFRSYLNHDYPPPPQEMQVWIAAWGEFSMLPLPFLPIPLDQYRLFMMAISMPVVIGSWLYMAGAARALSQRFGGKTRFYQYLNLFAFCFFPFWFLASLGDWFYSAALKPYTIPGLQGEYGLVFQAFFLDFPPVLWTVFFGIAALYNGLAAYSASKLNRPLSWWKSALIGWVTFLLPLALVSLLYR